MATIKSFTDLSQSKTLAEILPIESADMMWEQHYNNEPYVTIKPHTTIGKSINCHCVPCWSLAALLSVLPIIYTNDKKEVCGPLHIDITDSETPFVLWYVNPLHKGCIVELKTRECDNLVDACYEMIIKLYKLKML